MPKSKFKVILKLLTSKLKYINFINVSFLVYGITFIKGVLTRRFITPDEYGFFVNAQLLMAYGMYFQLGSLNALNFEIPGLVARGEDLQLTETVGSVKGFMTILSLFLLVIAPLFLLLDIDPTLKYGYMFMSVSLAVSLFVDMGENILRGYQDFNKLSKVMFIRAISMFVITVILTYSIGYYGLYIGLFLGNILTLFFIIKDLQRFKTLFQIRLISERIKVGFPIFLNGMLWSLFLTASQTIGFMKLSSTDMGEFSIAIMVYGAIMIVPSIVSQIVYPRILVFISSENSESLITEFYTDFMEYYNGVLTIISIVSLMIIPVLIETVLPNYSNGINSTLILLLSMFILGINGINGNIITGYRKAKQITVHLFFAFICLLISELLLLNQFGIDAIAISMVIAFVCYAILNAVYMVKQLSINIMTTLNKLNFSFILYIMPTFFLLYFGASTGAYIYGVIGIIINIRGIMVKIGRRIDEI